MIPGGRGARARGGAIRARRPLGWTRASDAVAAGAALAFVLVADCLRARASAAQESPARTSYAGGAWGAPDWWVAARTTGYWFESVDPATGVQLDRFGFLQSYDADLSRLWDGKLDLRLAGRFADADRFPVVETNHNRLYVAHARLCFDPWRVRARLGRMFLQEGPANHSLDGVWLQLAPARRWELRLWGGPQAPVDLDWEVRALGGSEAAGAAGARLLGTLRANLRAGLAFAYWEDGGRPSARRFGAEATWFPHSGLKMFGRGYYDTEQDLWWRIEFVGDHRPAALSPWTLRAQYLDRQPSIEATSYFARFDHLQRIRLGRASVRYRDARGYGGELECFFGFIDGRTSTRLGGALVAPFGRLGYSGLLGDGGGEGRWFGDLYGRPKPWAELAAGAVVATYALLEDAPRNDERDLVTLFARLALDLRDGVRGVAEIQGLQNPDFDQDVRVLLGLDLVAGGGASSFGLPGGRWLR